MAATALSCYYCRKCLIICVCICVSRHDGARYIGCLSGRFVIVMKGTTVWILCWGDGLAAVRTRSDCFVEWTRAVMTVCYDHPLVVVRICGAAQVSRISRICSDEGNWVGAIDWNCWCSRVAHTSWSDASGDRGDAHVYRVLPSLGKVLHFLFQHCSLGAAAHRGNSCMLMEATKRVDKAAGA